MDLPTTLEGQSGKELAGQSDDDAVHSFDGAIRDYTPGKATKISSLKCSFRSQKLNKRDKYQLLLRSVGFRSTSIFFFVKLKLQLAAGGISSRSSQKP